MAEDTLVKDVLSDAMIKAGADLTLRLDQVEWPVVAAFWLYLPELNSWRLIFASPVLVVSGPRRAYQSVQMALQAVPEVRKEVALSDIEVVEPNHYLVDSLRRAVNTGPTISGIRFTRTMINGQFIHDAFIYRVSDRAPAGQAA